MHLCDEDSSNPMDILASEMKSWIKLVFDMNCTLEKQVQENNIKRSLKPIFLPYFKTVAARKKANAIRSCMVQFGLGYTELKEQWKDLVRICFYLLKLKSKAVLFWFLISLPF